jgi:hypothetical protein
MIMVIHLTEQQRQAVEARHGEPVEVVDPVTNRVYVLVGMETYERVRSLLESSPERASAAGSPPVTASSAGERKPLRQRVRELPLPPEVAAEAKRYCKRLGLWGAKSRRQMEEQMKLQHYYGGRWIAELLTDQGIVVVAAAESLNDPVLDQQLSFLTAEERRSVRFESPTQLFDQESEVLTPFADESQAGPGGEE